MVVRRVFRRAIVTGQNPAGYSIRTILRESSFPSLRSR
jgi:hypothetical protein